MNKVILLAPTPPPVGGIASWTVRMLGAKLPNDWKVEVVDEKIIGNREFFGNRTRYDVSAEIRRCFRIWTDLSKKLKDSNAKVVHACIAANTMPVLREYISACITKWHKRKFIIHFRCTVPNMVQTKLNKFVVQLLCNKADCVMLLNTQSQKYVEQLTKTRTIIIPNFVDVEEISGERIIKERLTNVLYVGGVIESKGCLDIINVAKYFPQINFKLIGNAEEKCISAAKNVSNVMLTGSISHESLKEEYEAADVFMFLSRFPGEGFSNSLAEAMAAGLPCIVTDWAANADMIEDKGGVIVGCSDIKATQVAIEKLYSHEERRKCSDFNREKVRKKYNSVSVIRQYVGCYEDLLKD